MRLAQHQSQKPSIMKRCLKVLKGQALWITGAAAAAGLIVISCTTGSQAIIAPPGIPGATFVGSSTCAQCHENLVRDFRTADHGRLQAKGENAKDIGCESCHGPGSKHVAAGGGAGSIVNPKKSPETCFQCHLDKKAQFSLPYSHPVLRGKMSCSDCHNPHKGSIMKGGGTQLKSKNETCFQCHKAQRGPFVFEHEAVKEGCTSCHNPHGTVNQKMLLERNQTLCAKCHAQANSGNPASPIMGNDNHASNVRRGTCWSAGCHEAIHGSNVTPKLRY